MSQVDGFCFFTSSESDALARVGKKWSGTLRSWRLVLGSLLT